MKKIIYLVSIYFTISSCAHYYGSIKKVELLKSNLNQYLGSKICIRSTNNSDGKNMHIEDFNNQEVIESLKSKLLISREFECSNKTEYSLVISRKEEKSSADVFILTIGIIPHIFNLEYKVFLYDEKSNKTVDEISVDGYVVMSIFLTPFFFLHKSDNDNKVSILKAAIEKYSKE